MVPSAAGGAPSAGGVPKLDQATSKANVYEPAKVPMPFKNYAKLIFKTLPSAGGAPSAGETPSAGGAPLIRKHFFFFGNA